MSRLQLGDLSITYIGGPTALLELGGLRLLTDPTFDAPGQEYRPGAALRKLTGPAMTPASLGTVDVVLLSHDHHFDNLDHAGRAFLPKAGQVVTTLDGAERVGGFATGLSPWRHVHVPTEDGRALRITATPARHGPPDGDRGPVIGFALSFIDPATFDGSDTTAVPADSTKRPRAVYVSGDTVWFDGVAEVGRRFAIDTAVLFMGAARVAEAGAHHLTLTADEGVEVARAFPDATIVPLHVEGWAHFTESRDVIAQTFARAGLTDRLRWAD